MAWEARRGSSYYYRSRRVDGQVRKEYVGKGADAELVAKADEAAREAVREEYGQLRRFAEEAKPVVGLMKDLDEAVRLLTAGSLLAAGYHQHRGNWRKRRGRASE